MSEPLEMNVDFETSDTEMNLEADMNCNIEVPLPIASATRLGGIKVGENLSIAPDGTLSAEASEEDVEQLQEDVTDLKEDLTNADNIIYTQIEIAPFATPNDWKIDANSGIGVLDTDYHLLKYNVTPNTFIKVVSSYNFQFQSEQYVPSGGTSKRIGKTFEAGEYFLTVPDNGHYLIMSALKTSTTDHVYVLANRFDDVDSEIANGYYNRKVVTNGSYNVSGLTSGNTNRIRTDLIYFRSGDRVVIKNGTLQHACGMWKDSVSSVNNTRHDNAFIGTEETIRPDYTGYLVVVFRKSDDTALIPTDFDGGIEVYHKFFEDTIATLDVLNNIIIDSFTWADNTLLDYYGNIRSETNYFTTDSIDISEYAGMILNFCGYKYTGDSSGICFYDADGVFIKGVNPTSQGDLLSGEFKKYDIKIQIPVNVATCKMCIYLTKAYSRIYISIKTLAKQISNIEIIKNTDFGGTLGNGSASMANSYIISPSGWETQAETCYSTVEQQMHALGYDGVPVFIETDSHGNSLMPFAWLDKKDKTIKKLHLGDIVKDSYNMQDVNNFYDFASRVDNIACLVGNHEIKYGNEAMSNYVLTRYLPTTGRHLGSDINYYYTDDNDYKVRYIGLNPHVVEDGGTTAVNAFDKAQLTWLINVLKDSPHDVVVLNHVPVCTNLIDRNGQTVENSGPYPTNLSALKTILETYQAKTTGSVIIDGQTVSMDFSAVTKSILAVLQGHTHNEATDFSNGIRYYMAAAYLYGKKWSNTFLIIDRKHNNLLVYKFDTTANYSLWTLPLYSVN